MRSCPRGVVDKLSADASPCEERRFEADFDEFAKSPCVSELTFSYRYPSPRNPQHSDIIEGGAFRGMSAVFCRYWLFLRSVVHWTYPA